MKKLISPILLLMVLTVEQSSAQIIYHLYDIIPVNTGAQLRNPWAGGLNCPQFSAIDLNGDGIQDLFVFEREWNGVVKTFINQGNANQVDYKYAPEYRSKFPKMGNWTLLADYNCDGKADIFTWTAGGIKVYRNDYTPADGLQFTMVTDLLRANYNSNTTNVYVASTDIPAITDIDGDGDLDVLAYTVTGSYAEYYENKSMDLYGHCDSLTYDLEHLCWGHFRESSTDNTIILDHYSWPCDTSGRSAGSANRHSGSTLLALDLDGDQDKELLIGDIDATSLTMLENGGDPTYAVMDSVHLNYPAAAPADVSIFAASYFVDVNHDGKRDLLVSPNKPNSSENLYSAWYYQNNGTDPVPDFSFIKENFLQDEMIDAGSAANAIFFDYNGDSLVDMFIGNDYYYSDTSFVSKLALFKNTGTAQSPAFTLVSWDFANLSSLGLRAIYPSFGDLDGDGDGDMIIGEKGGKLYYYENIAGAGNSALFVLSQAEYFNIDVGDNAAPQLVDVDRDGLPDLLIGKKNGKIDYYRNTGTATAAQFSATPDNDYFGEIDVMITCCSGYSSPWLTENDSTGEYNLLVGSDNGYIYRYTDIDNNLTAAFTLIDSIYTGTLRSTISVADIDDDGRNELLVGEYTGGVAIYKTDSITGFIDNVNTVLSGIKKPEFLIFPNPNRGVFTITSKNLPEHQTCQVMITDLFGRMVYQKILPSFSTQLFDLSDQPAGLYFIRIISNHSTFTGKIIVSK